jgi:hypothetical protein
MCSSEELELLIGIECGHIQNNHCTYSWAFTYLNSNNNYAYRPSERSYKGAVNPQIVGALAEWIHDADITADRAGMICMDNPGRFAETAGGLFEKEYVDFFGRSQRDIRLEKIQNSIERNKMTTTRSLTKDSSFSEMERRIIASAEFLSCESLFTWRPDLEQPENRKFSGEVCDVRSSIILSGGQG